MPQSKKRNPVFRQVDSLPKRLANIIWSAAARNGAIPIERLENRSTTMAELDAAKAACQDMDVRINYQ